MAITTSGVGSGLDINGLITQLMTAERMPEKQMALKKAEFEAKLTALGSVKSALSTFQGTVAGLTSTSQFRKMSATLADTTIGTVTVSSIATASSYSLKVDQIAQSHKVKSGSYSSIDSVVGSGKLTIQFGTLEQIDPADPSNLNPDGTYEPTDTKFTLNAKQAAIQVDIGPGSNTLSGIRDAINAKKAGVTASIINDGGGFRLVLSATESGADASMKISVTDDDGNATDAAGLSQLAYDATLAVGSGQNMTQTQQAQSAVFYLDGIKITKASNVVSDVLSGVTLTLQKATEGKTTSLSVSRDTSGVVDKVGEFVKGYNELMAQLKELTAYNDKSKEAAVLQGDQAIRSVQTQLKGILNGVMAGSGDLRRLTDVGISFDKAGVMTFDTDKFGKALASNPDAVASLFGAYGSTTDQQVKYISSKAATQAGNYPVIITDLATQGIVRANTVSNTNFDLTGLSSSFTISINGKSSGNITLEAKNYGSMSALAAEMQTKINGDTGIKASGITASVVWNSVTERFEFSSTRFGKESKVEIGTASADAQTMLGMTTGKQATLFGGTLMSSTITAGVNDSLTLKVNGGAATAITLDAAAYANGNDLALHIQSKLDAEPALAGAKVVYNSANNRLEFFSANTGTNSAIEITSANPSVRETLGLSVRAGVTTGLDVAGSIGGVQAQGAGQVLTGQGEATGLALEVGGGLASPNGASRGMATYNRGFAYQLDQLLTSIQSKTGTLAGRSDSISKAIKGVDDQKERFERRMVTTEARYRAQFTALDVQIASLQNTSSYLNQQLAALTANNRR
ncbi:hypothetical protein GCM10007907_18990 [Chitinimonas prasina]|uniref:Flagellar hook-associated protein 2 n=1 Tax=Chitinimonas prasina TaxID=1434937 RepID=A0ABQ5YJI7_9NEIS|nr:flagellar filament capping protein FliD [Chitinimonas prasina]GLR13109.1 hypothetical protein GCM10007907_18990 [Chitinimonas prasina]